MKTITSLFLMLVVNLFAINTHAQTASFTVKASITPIEVDADAGYYFKAEFFGMDQSHINSWSSIQLSFDLSASSNNPIANDNLIFGGCNQSSINMTNSPGGSCGLQVTITDLNGLTPTENGYAILPPQYFGGSSLPSCPIVQVDWDGTFQPQSYCVDINLDYCSGYGTSNSGATYTINYLGGKFAGNESFSFCHDGNPSSSVTQSIPTNPEDHFTSASTFTDYKLFPNPSIGDVTIQFEEEVDYAIITIMDLQGSIMDAYALEQTNSLFVQTNHLAKGIYLVNVNQDGQNTTKKLIIQ